MNPVPAEPVRLGHLQRLKGVVLMIHLALALAAPTPMAGQTASPASNHSASLTPFSRDRTIFDSGAARGAAMATIPLSGSSDAPDGAEIEMRAVSLEDGGAATTPWVLAGPVTGGLWSGSLDVPRAGSWFRAEARVRGSSAAPAAMAERFGVGHVVMLIGQSEDARIFLDSFDLRGVPGASVTVPALVDDDAVFVIRQQEGGARPWPITVEPVTSSAPVTPAVAHLADVLTRNSSDKWLVVDAAHSGTARQDLVTPGGSREWYDFTDILDLVRADGGDLGLVMDTWTAADSAGGDDFRLKFYPFYAGMDAAGGTYDLGSVHAAPGNPVFPNILWDLTGQGRGVLDETVTRLAFHGPHRFELPASQQNKEDTRMSIRNMVDDALLAPIMRPKGPEILLYENGFPSSTDPASTAASYDPGFAGPYWADFAHPSAYSDDGLAARARHTGVAALYGLGLVPPHVPRFNRSYWEPSGAYVELWYEAPDGSTPPITTTRAARGLPALAQDMPHRTGVWGFLINTAPAENATIQGGRVRILPNAGSFTGTDVIRFGKGTATGVVQFPEDKFLRDWMNLPMVDLGLGGIEGVALEPMPDPADLANPLPATQTFAVTSGGPYFVDPGVLGLGVGQLTFAARLTPAPGAPTGSLLEVSGGNIKLERYADGSLRTTVKDSSNTVLVSGQFLDGRSALLPEGLTTEIVYALDLTGRSLKVWVGGAQVADLPLPANTGALASNRQISTPARINGLVPVTGTFEFIRIWRNALSTDGSLPAAAADAEILPPAAAVNAHPWKQGTDAP